MTKPTLRLVVAEDLRREMNGKVTAVGLFPDNVVVVQMPFDAAPPTKEAPILLTSLGVMFNISRLPEKKPGSKAMVSVDISHGGPRKQFLAPQEMNWPNVGESINVLGVMTPCPITSFGDRKFFVSFGDINLEADFEVRKMLLPAPDQVTDTAKASRRRQTTVVPKGRRTKAIA